MASDSYSPPSATVINTLNGDVVRAVLAPVAFTTILLIIIDAFIPQVEMFLTGGNIPVPMSTLKALLVLCACGGALVRLKANLKWFPAWAWWAFVIFIILDIPHLATQDLTTLKVISSYYGYYSLALIMPVTAALEGAFDESIIFTILVKSFYCCAALGLLQRLTNSPIVYPLSNDGSFEVIAWRFFATNEIRIFSFFVYSVNFGLFCTFVGCASLWQGISGVRTRQGYLLYVLSGICVYLTLTRVVYLAFAVGTLCILTMRFLKSVRVLRIVPILGFTVGLIIAYGGALGWLGGGQGVGDNVSLIQRLQQLAYYSAMFLSGNLNQKLLGIGYVQDANVNGEATYPIDNLYMALLLHIGIVGGILFLLLFWAIWQRLSKAAVKSPSPLLSGVCAVWSTFLAISLFDISTAFFPCCIMLLAIGGTFAIRNNQSSSEAVYG